MKKYEKISTTKKLIFGALVFIVTLTPKGDVLAVSYDPNEDYNNLGVKFWENQKPDIDFYINSVNRYLLEEIPNPDLGSLGGDWSIFALTRGMYTQGDYLNHIPKQYFSNYISNVEQSILKKNGNLSNSKITEWDRVILSLTPLNYDVKSVTINNYDFIEKISESFFNTQKQGINGVIFTLLALNSGGYNLYPNVDNNVDWNTEGKMIDNLLSKQIKLSNGGWALRGQVPDVDITAMAIQSLAPYYLSRDKFEQTGSKANYLELRQAVEKGLLKLNQMQKLNGGFESYQTENSESIAQVIVALTELNIDPKSDSIPLTSINETISFMTEGAIRDGVRTDNMVDALLTFWSKGTIDNPSVGGFRHVTEGNDGGSETGIGSSGMASDQASYGLAAYHRFLNNKNNLYDFSDQKNVPYQNFKAKSASISYNTNKQQISQNSYYLATKQIEKDLFTPKGTIFINWNSKEDGTGFTYNPGELIVMPDNDINLYGQYKKIDFHLTLNSNDGEVNIEVPKTFTVDDVVSLPKADVMKKDGYTFKGWYLNSEMTGNAITEIAKGTSNNITLYAKWDEIDDQVDKVVADIELIGEPSLQKTAMIKYVRTSFDNLDKKKQLKVNNINKLIDAEAKVEQLTIAATEEEITNGLLKEVEEAILSISEITLESKDLVNKARIFYNFLGEYQSKLDPNILNTLINMEEKISELQISTVINQIENISLPVTIHSKLEIAEARQNFELLDTIQKQGINNLSKLIEAEKELEKLLEEAEEAEKIAVLIKAAEDAIEKIGEVTLDSEEAIRFAAEQYELLDADSKLKVKNVSTLEDATVKFNSLKQQKEAADQLAVEQVINAIKLISSVTLDMQKQIENTRSEYEKLPLELKTKVPTNILNILKTAEVRLAILIQEEDQLKAQAAKLEQEILAYSLNKVTLKAKEDINKFKARLEPVNKYVSKEAKDHLDNLEKEWDEGFKSLVREKEERIKAEKQAAKIVSQLINNLVLGNEKQDQVISNGANLVADVTQARTKYEALSSNGKTLITSDEKTKLDNAIASVDSIEVVINHIKKLPQINKLTKNDMNKVTEANRLYQALTKIEQGQVTNHNDLLLAIDKINSLDEPERPEPIPLIERNNSRKPVTSAKRNSPLPKTGEKNTYQIATLGVLLLSSLIYWIKKEDNDVSL